MSLLGKLAVGAAAAYVVYKSRARDSASEAEPAGGDEAVAPAPEIAKPAKTAKTAKAKAKPKSKKSPGKPAKARKASSTRAAKSASPA